MPSCNLRFRAHSRALVCTLLALAPIRLHAQSAPSSTPAMRMQPATSLVDLELQHTSSGTSVEPPSTPVSMLMTSPGSATGLRGWTLMLHGLAFVADTQQVADSPDAEGHAHDKLFSTNWIMPMAQHPLGTRSQITVRTMLSLEPATIIGRFYPELFQQGETAYGKPIVDGQHPHDFVMELAALYDFRASTHMLLSLYAAPVGDPALGPTAYPHRESASEDPIAALGHHQQDSTHIAFNVLTGGLTLHSLRVEVSGFHGAEPTEARWHIQPSPNGVTPDSFASRITFVPTRNLAAQYSIGHITSPEALNPDSDQRRQTASLQFNRSFGASQQMPGMQMAGDRPASGNLALTALWGQARNQSRLSSASTTENSFLFEALLHFSNRNNAWTRLESAARTSELLAPSAPETLAGHVQAYTFGYDREVSTHLHLNSALGAQCTVYHAPSALAPAYGSTPFAAQVFLRLRLGSGSHS